MPKGRMTKQASEPRVLTLRLLYSKLLSQTGARGFMKRRYYLNAGSGGSFGGRRAVDVEEIGCKPLRTIDHLPGMESIRATFQVFRRQSY